MLFTACEDEHINTNHRHYNKRTVELRVLDIMAKATAIRGIYAVAAKSRAACAWICEAVRAYMYM